MSKYIDADKLTKSIEDKGLDCSFALKMERLDTLALIDELKQEQREVDGDDGKFVKILVRKEFAEQFQKLGDEIQAGRSSFIKAINQQEQPEGLHFTPLNRLIQKIPSENWNDTVNNYAKKLRDCLIKEGYRKDAEILQGYISYMNGYNVPMATMDGQEQPQVADASKMEREVDLEEEYKTWWNSISGKINVEHIMEWYMHETARHFYELGRNARKEK